MVLADSGSEGYLLVGHVVFERYKQWIVSTGRASPSDFVSVASSNICYKFGNGNSSVAYSMIMLQQLGLAHHPMRGSTPPHLETNSPLRTLVSFFIWSYSWQVRKLCEILGNYNWLVKKLCEILDNYNWLVRQLREILENYSWLARRAQIP